MRARVVVGVVAMVVVAGWVYLKVTGLSALPAPGRLETAVARRVRSLAVPADVRTRANPVPATADALATGMAHFADHCAGCHANDGSGATALGQGLYPKAPDMRAAATQRLTDGELFWIIEEGVRFTGMPGWSTRTPEGALDSWRLVHFVRHLPALTEEEKAAMTALNPKSEEQRRQELEEERFLRGEATP